MKLEMIIEKAGGKDFSGRIVNKGHFMPNTIAPDIDTIIKNIKDLIEDYQQHGGDKDPFWKRVKTDELDFTFRYDMQSFFMKHDYLNITNVAKLAGLNPGLVRQYASGVKHPRKPQADKIAKTVRGLAKQLEKVELV
ncbi:hypothetical protein [Flavitalea sp.]|nr:hypothetical protein [Flavitalea sp.]